MPNHLNSQHAQTPALNAVLTASYICLLNLYTNFYLNCTKNRIWYVCPYMTIYGQWSYMGIRAKFYRFQPINWSTINIFEWDQGAGKRRGSEKRKEKKEAESKKSNSRQGLNHVPINQIVLNLYCSFIHNILEGCKNFKEIQWKVFELWIVKISCFEVF